MERKLNSSTTTIKQEHKYVLKWVFPPQHAETHGGVTQSLQKAGSRLVFFLHALLKKKKDFHLWKNLKRGWYAASLKSFVGGERGNVPSDAKLGP